MGTKCHDRVDDSPREVVGTPNGSTIPKDRRKMLRRFIHCVWIEPGKGTIMYRIQVPKYAKRPEATELVLALDERLPPIARLSLIPNPPKR